MSNKKTMVYPYIPNSVPSIKEEMLHAVGAETVEEFYADIPEKLRLKRKLDLPDPLLSESELVRHIEGLLAKNSSTREYLSFLGAGCWQRRCQYKSPPPQGTLSLVRLSAQIYW